MESIKALIQHSSTFHHNVCSIKCTLIMHLLQWITFSISAIEKKIVTKSKLWQNFLTSRPRQRKIKSNWWFTYIHICMKQDTIVSLTLPPNKSVLPHAIKWKYNYTRYFDFQPYSWGNLNHTWKFNFNIVVGGDSNA